MICYLLCLLLPLVPFIFFQTFDTWANLHSTEFPRSGPNLNSKILIKILENEPHSALHTDTFLSSLPSFLHCLCDWTDFCQQCQYLSLLGCLIIFKSLTSLWVIQLCTLHVLNINLSSQHIFISLPCSSLTANPLMNGRQRNGVTPGLEKSVHK